MLLSAEEGTLTSGFGAEMAALVQEKAWRHLKHPVLRVGAEDRCIPASRTLEDLMLPTTNGILESILSAKRAVG